MESLSRILPMDQRSTDEQTMFKFTDLSKHRFYKQFKLFPVLIQAQVLKLALVMDFESSHVHTQKA